MFYAYAHLFSIKMSVIAFYIEAIRLLHFSRIYYV